MSKVPPMSRLFDSTYEQAVCWQEVLFQEGHVTWMRSGCAGPVPYIRGSAANLASVCGAIHVQDLCCALKLMVNKSLFMNGDEQSGQGCSFLVESLDKSECFWHVAGADLCINSAGAVHACQPALSLDIF